ncbi:MAG: AI-2E family transporter [Chloroflexi bacterium]|nr:AI-2E family transporter [Chloroflexota bacterium]
MNPPPVTSPAWTGRTKRYVAMFVVVIIGLALLRFSETIPIVIVAVILAYLLTPLAQWIDSRVLAFGPFKGRDHRGLSVLLTFVLVIAVIIVVILVVIPGIVNQFEEFGSRIPPLLESLGRTLERSLSHPITIGGEPITINGEPIIPLEQLREITGTPGNQEVLRLQDLNLVDATRSFISTLTLPAFSFLGGALTAIINIIFLLSMMFYLIRDGSIFAEKLIEATPRTYRSDLRRILYELGQVWNAYLRGQLTLSLVMGTTVFVVATLLGVPNPLILGLISGLLEFIPSIGSGLAIFPAALLALSSRSTTLPFLEGTAFAVVVVIVWAILQNIEAIVLVPRIMGGSLNLHPFVVIVAVIIGASLAGALGVILAAPAVASLRVLGQYIYGKLLDQDPFPPPRPRRYQPLTAISIVQRVWEFDKQLVRGAAADARRAWQSERARAWRARVSRTLRNERIRRVFQNERVWQFSAWLRRRLPLVQARQSAEQVRAWLRRESVRSFGTQIRNLVRRNEDHA